MICLVPGVVYPLLSSTTLSDHINYLLLPAVIFNYLLLLASGTICWSVWYLLASGIIYDYLSLSNIICYCLICSHCSDQVLFISFSQYLLLSATIYCDLLLRVLSSSSLSSLQFWNYHGEDKHASHQEKYVYTLPLQGNAEMPK